MILGRRRKGAEGARGRERGVSMIEMIVSMALLTVVSLIMYEVYVGTMRAGEFLESHGDLARMGQVALNQVKAQILQGRFAFQNDSLGADYLGALTLSRAALADGRLPTVDPDGVVAPDDSTTTRTGNAFFFARQIDPITVTANGKQLLADRIVFTYIYLAPAGGDRLLGADRIDLLEAVSAPFADADQLAGYGSDQAAVARALYNAGVQKAWKVGQPLNQAFFNINASTGSLGSAVSAPRIAMTAQTLLKGLNSGKVSGKMAYSVAMNTPPAPISETVSVFAYLDSAHPRFPGGFEVQCVGPTGGRKVVMRLVLLGNYGKKINSQVDFVTAAANQM